MTDHSECACETCRWIKWLSDPKMDDKNLLALMAAAALLCKERGLLFYAADAGSFDSALEASQAKYDQVMAGAGTQ